MLLKKLNRQRQISWKYVMLNMTTNDLMKYSVATFYENLKQPKLAKNIDVNSVEELLSTMRKK